MVLSRRFLVHAVCTLAVFSAHSEEPSFSGTWFIDLRTSEQRAQNAECGGASFVLQQVGKKITGSHEMATVGCGRLNEGGDGTVEGRVSGNRAFLVVTSGRNGAVVKGVARLKQDSLYWETKEEVKAGEPEGDSPLILLKGLLRREKQ
jgi:hypothetical protein